ncbi:uncharacterized protein LOC110409883 [Herrania umbratica]|uniref:Uncharacterized protein LOC110409883 n=1 Tax=Herrania umbratica TaxID=108875 RepID=A0A6J0ZKQ5_9ROSI|nr:uncharacterized protein LOC110409883 [Herrania umbratica]
MTHTSKTKISYEQKQESHFFNMGCNGNEFKRNDLKQERSGKNEPNKGPLESENEKGRFWTVCPYCYYMYEYEKKYEECCLLCQNCRKGFHGVAVAAPTESLLVKGKDGGYYSGYGFFPLGCFGDSFLGGKKEVGGGDTGKKHEVVEISDDSDDEKKNVDVKNEGSKVKVEVLNSGEGRRVMTRVKSVPRNTKKIMGKGVKGKKVEKMSVLEMNVESGNGVGDGDCGSGGGVSVGSGCQDGCTENELEFFEGDDDIFVGLKGIY